MIKLIHSHFSFLDHRSFSAGGLHSSFILRFAFCILHFAFLLPFPALLVAQQTPILLHPSGTLTNHSPDTLFCLPKQRLEKIMDQEEIYAQLIDALENRAELCDSALQLKTQEAAGWYGKLIETDILLEESELLRIQEKQKARRKTKIWFGVGTVAGLLIGVVL
jgi:hypothetical protein